MNMFKFPGWSQLVCILFMSVNSYADTFKKAIDPYEFNFERDHGSHVAFQNEWWYVTVNLHDPDKNPIGAQFTLFRLGQKPEPTPLKSWDVTQLYMAHGAMSYPFKNTFVFKEIFSRDSFELVKVQAKPFQLGIKNWYLKSQSTQFSPLDLYFELDDAKLQLTLEQIKPIILQGEGGLSQKGQEEGNASYYYSIPRLLATGILEFAGESIKVSGTAWFDREWSTSTLERGQIGWDWYALKFDDNTELMLYWMKREDNQPVRNQYAILIKEDGSTQILDASKIEINPIRFWQPEGGEQYATQWHIQSNLYAFDLQLTAIMPNQWIHGVIPYWEGAVLIEGSHQGSGYVEQFNQASRLPSLIQGEG